MEHVDPTWYDYYCWGKSSSREVEMDLASDPAQLEAVPTSTPRSLHVHGQRSRKE